MNKINFFTPISYRSYYHYAVKKTWSDRLLQLADSYFFFGGEMAYVTGKEFTTTQIHLNRAYDNVQYIDTYKQEKFFFHHEKVSTLKKTILIASYFFSLGILPLVILVTKAALRSTRQFEEIENVLSTPIFDSSRNEFISTIKTFLIDAKFKDIDSSVITVVEENNDYNTYIIDKYPKILIKIQHNKNSNILQNRYDELLTTRKMRLSKNSTEASPDAEIINIEDYSVLVEEYPSGFTPKYDYKDVVIENYESLGVDLNEKFKLEKETISSTSSFASFAFQFEKEVSLKRIIEDVIYVYNRSMRKKTSHKSYRNEGISHLYANECPLLQYKDLNREIKIDMPSKNQSEKNSKEKIKKKRVSENVLRKIIHTLNEKIDLPQKIEIHF